MKASRVSTSGVASVTQSSILCNRLGRVEAGSGQQTERLVQAFDGFGGEAAALQADPVRAIDFDSWWSRSH